MDTRYSPKFSILPVKLDHVESPPRKLKSPEELSTINRLRICDVDFQELVIEEKEVEYQLYVTNNQFEEMMESFEKLLKPVRVVEEQIGIWQGVVKRKDQELGGYCALLA